MTYAGNFSRWTRHPRMSLYETYGRHKDYTTPTVGPKHIRRLDGEFWSPLACRPDMAVLEIGCGTGLFLAYLHHKGVRDFVGIDHDPNLKDVIPPEVADRFEVTDVREFLERQAGKRRFDRIAMFDVLEHFSVDEGREMLGKILDVLAADGKIIIKVPNASSPWGRQFQYGDLTHKAAYTPESLRQLATASGYECTSCFPHYLGSPSRRVLDRLWHGLVGRMVMTPPEIWTANFFAVLEPE